MILTGLVLWVFIGLAPGPARAEAPCRALAVALDLDPGVCGPGAAQPASVQLPRPPQEVGQVESPLPPRTISFREGGARLSSQARDDVRKIGLILSHPRLSRTCLRLVGHSDAGGGAATNRRLSLARANEVKARLVAMDTSLAPRIEVDGRGETEPLQGLAPRDDLNRRVEVFAGPCG
jgi:outer membrane protein OmpA-like peptidoglycan-associated protein